MGLHLCFELAVPRDTAMADVVERVRQLRRVAATLPFDKVGPLVLTAAGQALGDTSETDNPLANWFRFCAHCRLGAHGERTGIRRDLLPDAVGFAIVPGDYCEGATFGLAWVPPKNEDGERLHEEPSVWHWHTVCKTQYASNLGDDHLIRCHTSLVALLDNAPDLGFEVTVRDETKYWQTRDTNVLIAEVAEMNRIVAGIAGAFYDAAGGRVHVDGAIFKHPEFEELETRQRDNRN